MKMNNIKIIAWLFLLTICSDKATCSDGPIPTLLDYYSHGSDYCGYSSNGSLVYRLSWHPDRSRSVIRIMSTPETGELCYEIDGPDHQKNIGEFSKEQVIESLSYFHDRIKEYGTQGLRIIGEITDEVLESIEKSKKLNALIPNISLLENYFADIDSLRRIELYCYNKSLKNKWKMFCIRREMKIEEYWWHTSGNWVKIQKEEHLEIVLPESKTKVVRSSNPISELLNDYGFSSNGLLVYKLSWNPERSTSTIEVMPKPKPGKPCYELVGPTQKEQITESLNYFHDKIKEQGTHYVTITGEIYEAEDFIRSTRVKELIPDTSLLMNYFAEIDSLVYIELYVKSLPTKLDMCIDDVNMDMGRYGAKIFQTKLHMCRDGTLEEYWQTLIRTKSWVKIPRKSRWDGPSESEA